MNPFHNICGKLHNGKDATCEGGPSSIWSCAGWFYDMLNKQWIWIERTLRDTPATFQVIVTHFPPQWGQRDWECLADRYGIDLFVSGHVHKQQIFAGDEGGNDLQGTCTVVSGGGGGITSEEMPAKSGFDDAYGFVHITLSAEKILVEAISHTGMVRKVVNCGNRQPNPAQVCQHTVRSMESNQSRYV